MEEIKFEYEYDVRLICESGNEYLYGIEADCDEDAILVANEFFSDDYPHETVVETKIIERRELNE